MAALLWARGWTRDGERLGEAVSLLALGEVAAAAELLDELSHSPFYAARARAGLRVAEAFGARSAAAPGESIDATPYPLALLARRAFETGRFEGVLEIDEIAAAAGQPTVPAVSAAARIELGEELEGAGESGAASANRLLRSLHDHLAAPPEGTVLRDRTGRRLGSLADGGMVLAEDVRPNLVPRSAAQAAAGCEAPALRLSLDLALSARALAALGDNRGSIVVVDAASGEILVAVSDARTFDEGGSPALEQGREPASIAKIITTTAALRAGIDPDGVFADMTCNGHQRYDGQFLYCPYIAGPLRGLDRAMAVSCNVAFADLGVRLGRRRMLDELRRFGFGDDLGPFPGGRILESRGDDRQLADISIGLQATELTPLHAALVAAVMANDGVMPVPTLLHAEDGRLGFHPRSLSRAPGRRVIEAEWLPQLLSAMAAVVEGGTARGIAPQSFPVAMKTGTASDPRSGFHVNYIGIGPMPEPRVAFCVRLTHNETSRGVRDAASEVTRRLLWELGQAAKTRYWPAETPPPARDSRVADLPQGGDRT